MQDWNQTDQIAGQENAGLEMVDQFAELEDDGLNHINWKCRTDQVRRSITIYV